MCLVQKGSNSPRRHPCMAAGLAKRQLTPVIVFLDRVIELAANLCGLNSLMQGDAITQVGVCALDGYNVMMDAC